MGAIANRCCSRSSSFSLSARSTARRSRAHEPAHRHHHLRRPRAAQHRARARLLLCRASRPCLAKPPRSNAFAQKAPTSMSASGRSSSCRRSIATICPECPGIGHGGAIPYGGYTHLLDRRFEESIHEFLARAAAAGPESRHLQRARACLPRPRLSDSRRPGAPQRPQRSRQPVDVPHWPPRGQSAPASPRARSAGTNVSTFSRCFVRPLRFAWTSRTAAGRDIFFLGMDYPEGARVLNISDQPCGSRLSQSAAAPPRRSVDARHR